MQVPVPERAPPVCSWGQQHLGSIQAASGSFPGSALLGSHPCLLGLLERAGMAFGGFTQPWQQRAPGTAAEPAWGPGSLPTPLLAVAGSASGEDSQPQHRAGLVFLSWVFSEPALEDLERRSCSSAVTYLPCSTEGINLSSWSGAGALSPSQLTVQAL